MIGVKRIYENPSEEDGFRILVDRLWPRGLKKEKAKVDLWLKEIAPSDQLRKWFSHKKERWVEFKRKYKKELENKEELIKKINELERKYGKTLLFSAKDVEHNNAVVLMEVIKEEYL